MFWRRFAARPDQVGAARHWLAEILPRGHPCRDAGVEVISELVTNSVLYGSTGPQAEVRVFVQLLSGRRVYLAVTDTGGTDERSPTVKNAGHTAVGGRGLAIVARLSARLSWLPIDAGHQVRVLLDPAVLQPEPPSPGVPDLDAFLTIDDRLGDV